MKILVTGCAGFIGSHLVDKLIELDHEVYGIDNLMTGSENNVNPKIKKFQIGDIRDLESLSEVFVQGSPDYVFHLAAIARTPVSIMYPSLTNEINVSGLLNVLELSRGFDVQKVIFSSSNIVYSDKTPYYVTKLAGEAYMRVYDSLFHLPTLSFRFSNVYGSLRQSEKGEGLNVLANLRKSKKEKGYIEITGDGTQSRDFTHVDDIVDGLIKGMNPEVRRTEIDLCTGKNITMNEVAKMFNCEVKYIPERQGDIKHIYQSALEAKRLLDFEAKKQLKDYIKIYTE